MQAIRWGRSPIVPAAVAFALLAGAASAGSFEDQVRARWRGAWVVLDTEVYSSCSGSYERNVVHGTLVSNRGGRRFLPGELGQVERLQLKKKKVDLMLTLAVPYRVSWQDGPFVLHDRRSCGVALEIDLPRNLTQQRDVEGVDALVARIVRRYDTREAAIASGAWNERETEPIPDDYDQTLARHATWQAEQTNVAIDLRRETALEQAAISGRAIDDDPDYLQGLAAGVDQMKRWTESDCGRLLGHGFRGVRNKVPDPYRGDTPQATSWRKGYEDGQRLVYHLVLVERLGRCYVPVPSVDGAS